MIPSVAEIVTALWGALRLARFDREGLTAFSDDPGAAWQSFFAMVLVAPLYFAVLATDTSPDGETAGLTGYLYEAVVFFGGWFTFPVIVWHVLDAFGRQDRFARFISAYNWTSVVQSTFFLVPALAVHLFPGAGGFLGTAGILIFMYILAYMWFVTKNILDIAAGQAILVVVLDILVSILWSRFANWLAMS